jgi:hypothetical protein
MPDIGSPDPEDHIFRNVGRMIGDTFQVTGYQKSV